MLKRTFLYIGQHAPNFCFKVTFLDGTSYRNGPPDEEPRFEITYLSSKGYWLTILFQGYGVAEAYVKGYLDITGNLRDLIFLRDEVEPKVERNAILKRLNLNSMRNYWHELWHNNNNILRAKRNAQFHYNRGTEMFRLFLDDTMTYTCAYWKDDTTDVTTAEKDKIDHTLKKLRLEPGMTMVDVGGGWGSVLLRAYEKYGVIGTNVSPTPDQNAAMQKEIDARGLTGKITIKECDFREDPTVYDRYLSLGVYEHAGKAQLEDWIRAMAHNLKPGGLGMLHFIGNIRGDLDETGIFIRKFIFPGGYLPGLAETLELMDKYDLEILDIENLRRHYSKTLSAWGANFDANWEKIRALNPQKYDAQFRRQWRFYLIACSAVFDQKNSSIGLFQITFSKGRTTTYPMTREFLYDTNVL